MNPELRRNLWLELTAHRLVVTPIVIVLVAALYSANDARPWPSIFSAAMAMFLFLVHFWGTRKASEAVTEEVRDRTWDWQRLSSLAPWQLAWGKLVGATAFTWYGGAICLGLMALASAIDPSRNSPHYVALGLVASALALHGVALAGSLQASRKDSRVGSRIATLMLIPVAIGVAGVYLGGGRGPAYAMWYGMRVDITPFISLSTCAFAAWAVLAVHREMSRELKVRKLPWAYPAFAVFVGAYVAGFTENVERGFVFATYAASILLVYYGIFADVTNAISVRRLATRIRAGEWRRVIEALPLWVTALAIAAIFAVAASLQENPLGKRFASGPLGLFPVVAFLFALRDASLLLFFALSPRGRRPEGVTLLYIAILSWLLPGLLALMGLAPLATALMPVGMEGWKASLIAAGHVAVVWILVAWRWRKVSHALDLPRKPAPRGV